MDTQNILPALKEYILPSNEVPLSKSRQPFVGLTESTIESCITLATRFPEKIGRLTKSINKVLNKEVNFPKEYALKEIHIDLALVNNELYNHLTSLGFEPDNFVKLHPEEYNFCFTMEFCIELGATHRVKEIHDFMLQQYEKAAKAIQESQAYGYIEMESYSSKYVKEFDFKPLTENSLAYLPFTDKTFEIYFLPNNETEADKFKIELSTHKKADLHIKTPTSQKGQEYSLADSLEMQKFRDILQKCGFYEIISEGGNYIFTGQFLDGNEAKRLFADITLFAENYGGITGLKYEICTAFWRKDESENTAKALSKIPNLIKYKP
jgi:hypothetical protein